MKKKQGYASADGGDGFILQEPFYSNHEMAVTMLGCTPVVATTDKNHQLDLDALRSAITKRSRAIVTISPNNPSGVVYPKKDLQAVTALCREFGLFHISDEAYAVSYTHLRAHETREEPVCRILL